MSKKVFLSTIFIFLYEFKYLGLTVNFLRVIEKVVILWTVPLNYQLILRMIAIESMHSLSNLKYVGIFDYLEGIVRIQKIYARISKRYLQVMKLWCKTTSVFSKNNFSHSSSISTDHMSYRTQKIWDLSFHSCNNNISLLSTGTRACGLGLLCSWMVHGTFSCSA